MFDKFKEMFSGQSPELPGAWNVPESIEDVEHIFNNGAGLHAIYKHSYRCAVCSFSKNRVEAKIGELDGKVTFHFVDVIQNRFVSDHIAALSGIHHASPQLLIVKNGEVIRDASHGEIRAELIEECVGQ